MRNNNNDDLVSAFCLGSHEGLIAEATSADSQLQKPFLLLTDLRAVAAQVLNVAVRQSQ